MTKWVLWWLDNCFHGKFGLSVHLKFKFLCVRRLQIFILNSSWATDSHRTPHFLYYFVWGNLKLSTLKVVFFKSRIFWNLKWASKTNFYPCPECPVLAWIWIKVSVIKYHRPGPQQGLFSKPGWEKLCFLCKSTEEAEAQLTPEGCQSVQTVLFLTWSLCCGCRDNKNAVLLSAWLLRDEPAQTETCLWFPARGSENPMYFTVCIHFSAENLRSLHKGLWFNSGVSPACQDWNTVHTSLLLFVSVLRNCSCCGYRGKIRMSQPVSRMWMNVHKGLLGPVHFWHTKSFCSHRSSWLFRAFWHLQIEVLEPLKSYSKRLSSNWFLCLAWT